jgi:glycosyltransferase involved in cell wall biosynthesis
MLYEGADGLVIPGGIAETTIRDTWHIKPRSTVLLPNLVDEEKFQREHAEARRGRTELRASLGVEIDARVVLIAARLHEATKGVLGFLKRAIGPGNSALHFLIAGDGPGRSDLDEWLKVNDLRNVHLLGHVPESRLIELLAAADIACLPSLRDPNPLFLVEAIWSGLPVMVSRNCGNWPEVVIDRHNGWLFDPLMQSEIDAMLSEVVVATPSELEQMGARSKEIAAREFSTVSRVHAFYDQLEALPQP